MYESFYGLMEKPFSLLPDPSFLYLGRPHSMTYSVLEYGVVSQAGFTVITGEVGSGKTTLIRHLLNQLDCSVTVGLITNTGDLAGELLRFILLAFGRDYRDKETVELHEDFEKFLIGEYAAGRRTVLLVDEAQNLGVGTLEELRMLSNVNADKDLLLQIVLVGQPELRTKLEQPELEQFAQRVAASYHLSTLSEEETEAYIHHRLMYAGAAAHHLFTGAACAAVYEGSGGIPRLINVLCDTALVYGYAEGASEITERIVNDVIQERAAGIQRGSKDRSSPGSTRSSPGKGAARFDRETARELFSSLRRK